MKTIQLETEGYQPPKSGLVLLQCLVGLLFFTFVIRFWYLQIHRGADFAQQARPTTCGRSRYTLRAALSVT